jgi:hypothetical protein
LLLLTDVQEVVAVSLSLGLGGGGAQEMQINSDEMSRISFLIEQQSGCGERLFNFMPGPTV